jgi:hypothetical protein
MMRIFPSPVPEMTSVLYGGSLNYQIGNPVRFEINKLNTAVNDLKKVVEAQNSEITAFKQAASEFTQLKSQVATLERMNRDLMATIATLQSKGGS